MNLTTTTTTGASAPKVTDSQIIFNNGMTLFARRIVLWGFNGVLIVFLPRYLGAEGLGQLAFALSFAGLFGAAISLGAEKFLIKEVARDRTQVNTHLMSAIGIRILTASAVFGLVVAIANLLDYSADAKRVMYIAAAIAIALSFTQLMTSILHGLENMTWPAMTETLAKLLLMAAGITVLVLGFGVVAYAIVLLVATFTNFVLNAVYIGRRFPLGVMFSLPRIKTLIKGGSPFLLMGFLLTVYNETDIVVLRLFTNDVTVGWYSAASRLYRTFDIVPVVLTTALLPTLARVHFSDARSVVAIAGKSITIGALAVVPVALGVSILSSEIINFLPFPDTFQNSAPLLMILALSIPVTGFLTILGTIAIAVDRQKAWAYALLATVALNVVLNILTIPYFQRAYENGGIGAALTTVACEVLMVVVGISLMPKGVFDRKMVTTLFKVLGSGGAMVLVCLVIKSLNLGTVPLIVAGAATYLTLVLVTKAVMIEDLIFVRETVLRRFKRVNAVQVS